MVGARADSMRSRGVKFPVCGPLDAATAAIDRKRDRKQKNTRFKLAVRSLEPAGDLRGTLSRDAAAARRALPCLANVGFWLPHSPLRVLFAPLQSKSKSKKCTGLSAAQPRSISVSISLGGLLRVSFSIPWSAIVFCHSNFSTATSPP